MASDSYISPNEIRSRSGPPSRVAATQEPDMKAVSKPAREASLALIPSHTAGITTKPGSASKERRRSGGDIQELLSSSGDGCRQRPASEDAICSSVGILEFPSLVYDLGRPSDHARHAAIDVEHVAVHEVGRGSGKEHGGTHELLDLSPTPGRG